MTMNLNPEPTSSKKSKSYKKALRVGGAISLVGVGSTFAANISLNNDANVEFGQGVAQTAACDSDGFFVNPVSYYDNTSSTFRLDYVEVSGLNLIPVGAISDSYNSSTGEYDTFASPADQEANPGKYYDSTSNTWANTCDQVVLDFKAYTDQTKYSTNTLDGYEAVYASQSATPNTISSPVLWNVNERDGIVRANSLDYSGMTSGSTPNIAIIWDAANNENNKGVIEVEGNYWNFYATYPSDNGGTGYVKESSFRFSSANGHFHYGNTGNDSNDPAAGAIAKITVESMKYFPSDYYIQYDNNTLGQKVNP